MIIIILIVIAVIVITQYKSNEDRQAQPKNTSLMTADQANMPTDVNAEQTNASSDTPDYSQSYQRRYLLTKNEWYEYKKLKRYASERQFVICPKVRLLDIIEPRRGKEYMSLLGKIQSKHVDFAVCDTNLRVIGVVEIDDNSHNQKDRQERDMFVDQVLTSVGYKVIHTRSVNETTLDVFKNDVA